MASGWTKVTYYRGDPVPSFMRGRFPIIPSSCDPGGANNVDDDKVRSCSAHSLF